METDSGDSKVEEQKAKRKLDRSRVPSAGYWEAEWASSLQNERQRSTVLQEH